MKTIFLLFPLFIILNLKANELGSKIENFFNNFDGKNEAQLLSFYDENVIFEDPLVRFENRQLLKDYYQNVYEGVKNIKFEFGQIHSSGNDYYANWTMIYSTDKLNSGNPISVNGLSHIRFNQKGLVIYHRDYFDVGQMLYEQIPLLKGVIRMIKRKLHD